MIEIEFGSGSRVRVFGAKVMAVLRIGPRRAARRGHIQSRRHGKDERRRSAGVARRRPLTHHRPSRELARRTTPLELAAAASGLRGARGLTHARQQGLPRQDHRPASPGTSARRQLPLRRRYRNGARGRPRRADQDPPGNDAARAALISAARASPCGLRRTATHQLSVPAH